MGVVEPTSRIDEPPVRKTTDRNREVARAQAARFAAELQRRARHARTRRRGPLLKAPDMRALVPKLSLASLARPLPLSFILAVVVPSLLALLYFGVLASNVYEAEARFAVRTGAISGVDALTSLAGIPSINQVQDSLIVANFVASRAAVEALERRVGLRTRYTRSTIDWVSRLETDAPIEDLVKFWQRQVSAAIESPSGIITVRVRGFTQDDARLIAEALVRESEALVNRLGAQARTDLVANSERELQNVEQRLRAARERLNQLRVSEGVIDPQLTAQGINLLIGELRAEAVKLEQEITVAQRTIGNNAPQLVLMRTRLTAIKEQTDALQNELTLRRAEGKDAISGVMTRFDQLALERQVLERQYATAAASLEQARAAAARQQMYLATFMHPVQPEDPAGPHRKLYSALIALGLLVLWAMAASAFSRWRARAG